MNVIRAAVQQPARSRELIDGLLELLSGSFRGSTGEAKRRVEVAQRAFAREGWSLSADGKLYSLGEPELVTGGRQALDEQLSRLRNSAGDPGQALGSAKEVLEAVAKFVLEEFGVKTPKSFGELLSAARTQLGIHPRQIVGDAPGNAQVRSILQASWTIAKEVDDLRNLQGTGHGRTLPTGITPEIAMLVVREACSNAQFLLSSLDAHMAEKAVSDTD